MRIFLIGQKWLGVQTAARLLAEGSDLRHPPRESVAELWRRALSPLGVKMLLVAARSLRAEERRSP